MKLSAETLLNVLGAVSGQDVADRAESVALVRRVQPNFAPTLYSAWQAEGDQLNPGLRHELDAAAARIAFYRGVAAELTRRVPGLTPIKGLEVAALYPDGFVRTMNDLDYVASTQREVWLAVAALTEDGWDIDTATFSQFDGELQIMVSMRRQHEDQYQLPYGVEIATYFALGDLGGIAPLATLAAQWRLPAIKNLLMLLHERFEQPYRARDLVDAALLCAALAPDQVATMHQAVAALELSTEYAELAGLVERCGLDPLPALRTWPSSPYVTRARRLARSLGLFARPVIGGARHLQRRNIAGTQGLVERRLSEVVWPRVPVLDGIRGGLLAFGLPLEGPAPAVESARLCSRDGLAWVDTPVARFLLTIGDDVTQSAVDELTIRPATDAESDRAAA